MIRVLVTGASGAIANAFANHAGRRMEIDLISLRGDWRIADFSRYDCVLHTAGIAHVKFKDGMQDEYMRVNRDLTLEVAKAAKAAGVKQFVFLSSMLVFGPAAPAGEMRVIDPDTPPAPENAYGRSKLEAEEGLRALETEDFAVAIVRPPMVYGGGTKGNFSTLMKHGGKLPVFPRIGGQRSLIYMENLTAFIEAVITDRASGTFHPADRETASAPQILRAIRAAQGKGTWLCPVFDPLVRLIKNSSPARKIFGGIAYAPEMTEYGKEYRSHDLESALKEMYGGK